MLAVGAVQGRVNATARTLIGAGTIVGSQAGGLLGDWIGLGNTLIVGAIGMMLAIPIVLFSPLRHLDALPAHEIERESTKLINVAKSTSRANAG